MAGGLGPEKREVNAFVSLFVTIIMEISALYWVHKGKPQMAKLVIPFAITATIVITGRTVL